MKFRALALGMGLLFASSFAQAVPFLYTFEGTISSIEDNGTLYTGSRDIGGVTFSVGESVTYEFKVDRSSQGFCTSLITDGCDFSETSLIPTNSADYFFSEIISATYGNGGSVPFGWKEAELQWGLESSLDGTQLNGGSAITVRPDPLLFSFLGNNIPLFLDLASFNAVPTFTPVTFLTGLDSWDEGADVGAINSTLSLVSITPIAVIPSPSTLALFAAALLLLFPFYRKRKQVAQVA